MHIGLWTHSSLVHVLTTSGIVGISTYFYISSICMYVCLVDVHVLRLVCVCLCVGTGRVGRVG